MSALFNFFSYLKLSVSTLFLFCSKVIVAVKELKPAKARLPESISGWLATS